MFSVSVKFSYWICQYFHILHGFRECHIQWKITDTIRKFGPLGLDGLHNWKSRWKVSDLLALGIMILSFHSRLCVLPWKYN